MSLLGDGERDLMGACSLDTLGTYALRVNGHAVASPATQKARALLAYLVMHQGTEVARERLLELFWPEAEPERARNSLRTALYSIRRGLREAGADVDAILAGNKATVCWMVDTEFDVARLTALAQSADRDAHARAFALYRGDFLEGDYDEWSVVQRERISALYERLLSKSLLSAKDPKVAERLIERNPYDEDAFSALIDAELAAGRRAAAAKAVHQYRVALQEIGTAPSAAFEQRYAGVTPYQLPEISIPRLPFVGREVELSRVARVMQRISPARGVAVVVHGEPGIGKSAFLQVVGERALADGMRSVSVHCLQDDPRPFGAWGGLYESLVGANLGEFVRATREASAAIAVALVRALVVPTLVFVDDVQYLRDESLDIFSQLARRLAACGHPLLVGCRPEALQTIAPVLEPLETLDIELRALSAFEVDLALATTGFPSRSELLDALMRRTDGHPLFVASLLESLAVEGVVRRSAGKWEVLREVRTDVALPTSLARSIETRLRSKGNVAAEVACILALDVDASTDELATVIGDEPSALDALDDLLALGVLFEPASGAQFAFSHDLVREVAARLCGVGRRKRIHRVLAVHLARVPARNGAVRRARHLEAARDTLAAIRAYEEAGHSALEVNAPREAAARFERALGLLESVEPSPQLEATQFDLLMLRARSYQRTEEMHPTLDAAEDLVRTARRGSDRARLAEALEFRSRACHLFHRYDETLSDAVETVMLADELGRAELRAQALSYIARVHMMRCNREMALSAGRDALASALAAADPTSIRMAAETALRAQTGWWEFGLARQSMEILKTAVSSVGWLAECRALISGAFFWYHARLWDRAGEELDRAEDLLRRDDRIGRSDADLNPRILRIALDYARALVDSACGSWESTARFCRHAETTVSVGDAGELRYYTVAASIDAVLETSDSAQIARAAERFAELDKDHTFPPGSYNGSFWLPYVLRARLAARMRLPDAAVLLEEALDSAERDAARAPSDCQRSFERLGRSAAEIGAASTVARAKALGDSYAALHALAVQQLLTTP
jgi:DNA-binding SARP family transcriptional activator